MKSPKKRKQKANQLIPAISELRRRALAIEATYQEDLQQVAADYQPSARNLLHYLAIRQTDMRHIQNELVALGLTSLGKTETAVMYAFDSVLHNLHLLAEEPYTPAENGEPVECYTGPMMLDMHTEYLLGEASGKRKVRIMVTMARFMVKS